MVRAIDEYEITGVQTTLAFCRFVMLHEAFTSGNFDTHFVKHYFTPEVLKKEADKDEAEIAAALVAYLMNQTKQPTSTTTMAPVATKSKWKTNRVK